MKLPKTYEPKQYEADIYALWEKKEAFRPTGEGQAYSIAAPPPNANGDLHIGYALTLGLEDILIRYHRLKGERTLFVPGADHAGFETWVVYEKKLAKEGKSRFDFSREELYNQVWQFVAANRQNFEAQMRRLGASFDWPHFTFTLDDKVIRQAYATFRQMWQEGLVYRGERLVNFCTFHGTSFADIEVEYAEEEGQLYYIRYPLTDGSGDLIVATTRPETMLGDTGVAVHPADNRYQAMIGKTVRLPLVGREVPVIGDNFVDPKYGTGAVKLTPAHDPNDFAVAERHRLPMMSVINHEGRISGEVPHAYLNLTVEQARQKVIEDLKGQGFLVKTEPLKHSVGHCYKCHSVIEPLLREQWFVNMEPLAKLAMAALNENKVRFYPNAKKDQVIGYLKNLRDWNISRQIAWGIPIPAFQNIEDPDDWIYDERVNEELLVKDNKTYKRDPDVLDTWFSSSAWPYVVLDYPDSQDFKDFYPLSVMETGGEILYPWVSRMLMLGLYTTREVPFEDVYIHGYVMAEDGSKMSKSVGNTIDPMALIEEFGSDALRMGLIAGRVPAVNRGFDRRRVEEARNFCNKLWNIARFIEDKVGDKFKRPKHIEPKTIADHWVLSKLQRTSEALAKHLDNYRFSEAYELIYHFIWDDFADWYVESAKVAANPEILAAGLEACLILIHPFAPFLSETIWQTLAWEPDSLLATSRWPEVPDTSPEAVKQFDEIKTISSEVRNLIATLKLKDTKLHYLAPEFISQNAGLIEHYTNIKTVTEVQLRPGVRLTNTPYQCWLDVTPKILQAYLADIKQKLESQKQVVASLQARLNNPDYTAKAPPAVVADTKQQLDLAESNFETIRQEYNRFAPPELTKPTTTPAVTPSNPPKQP